MTRPGRYKSQYKTVLHHLGNKVSDENHVSTGWALWSSKNLLFRFAKTNHLDYFPIKRETPLLNEPCQTQPELAEKKVQLGVTCTQEFFYSLQSRKLQKSLPIFLYGQSMVIMGS